METCSCPFLIKILEQFVVHSAHALWLMHHPRTCAPTNGFQQPVYSASLVCPANLKVQVVSASYRDFFNFVPPSFLLLFFLLFFGQNWSLNASELFVKA